MVLTIQVDILSCMINLSNVVGVDKILLANGILENLSALSAANNPEIYKATCSLLGNLMNEGDPTRSTVLSHTDLIEYLVSYEVDIGSP